MTKKKRPIREALRQAAMIGRFYRSKSFTSHVFSDR